MPYLAITAHWIWKNAAGSLKLRTALIGFHRLRRGHSGKSMADAVLGLLDRVEVATKVSISAF